MIDHREVGVEQREAAEPGADLGDLGRKITG
jgi:hypothetical protein